MSGTARDELLTRSLDWFRQHGVADTSLRTLASGIGTSHRMLHYHFGSREGLLAAVVQQVETAERDLLTSVLSAHEDPVEAGRQFWAHVATAAQTFAPLYFELSGLAMQGLPFAEPLRTWLAAGWLEPLTDLWVALGEDRADAEVLARINLATVRGLLFELAITGDQEAVDAAMTRFGQAFGITS